jgi:hypothetical protein
MTIRRTDVLAGERSDVSGWWDSQRPADNTSSPRTMEVASSWLRDCISTHAECTQSTFEMRLPTRLLELNQPSPGFFRLRESSSLLSKPQYMTLSHCWGTTKHLKLTAATWRLLSDGIPMTSLARTFQDAMQVAVTLGFKFIWVDSLCIKQDSLQDWQHEASAMGAAYRGSSCNIAATALSNGSGGCFRPRNPRYLKPCIISTNFSNSSNSTYLLESQTIPRDAFQPLLTRG